MKELTPYHTNSNPIEKLRREGKLFYQDTPKDFESVVEGDSFSLQKRKSEPIQKENISNGCKFEKEEGCEKLIQTTKLYLLTEQVFNGTVTMSVISTGVRATSFREAINKIKKLHGFVMAEIHEENDRSFRYTLEGGLYPVMGNMSNKELHVIV